RLRAQLARGPREVARLAYVEQLLEDRPEHFGLVRLPRARVVGVAPQDLARRRGALARQLLEALHAPQQLRLGLAGRRPDQLAELRRGLVDAGALERPREDEVLDEVGERAVVLVDERVVDD